jgi:hypothetical protein
MYPRWICRGFSYYADSWEKLCLASGTGIINTLFVNGQSDGSENFIKFFYLNFFINKKK